MIGLDGACPAMMNAHQSVNPPRHTTEPPDTTVTARRRCYFCVPRAATLSYRVRIPPLLLLPCIAASCWVADKGERGKKEIGGFDTLYTNGGKPTLRGGQHSRRIIAVIRAGATAVDYGMGAESGEFVCFMAASNNYCTRHWQ